MDFSWWWLFVGSFMDALIGPNLVVPGEPFFLAAGFQLNQGIMTGVIAVIIGAIIGDQLSFAIGQTMGSKGQRQLRRRFPKTRRATAKAKLALKKYGMVIVVAARLLGPIAWVMPFLAGSYRMTWWKFSACSLVGVTLGVGQFIFAGAMMGHGISLLPNADSIWLFVQEHWLLFTTLTICGAASVWFYRQHKAKWFKILGVWLVGLSAMNYVHFFINSHQIDTAFISQSHAATSEYPNTKQPYTKQPYTKQKWQQLGTITDYRDLPFEIYPGLAPVYQAQPINVIYLGNNPNNLMTDLGWQKNKTFSKDKITLDNYLDLIEIQQPPVSDLYWDQQPQWSAYQLKGDLLKRSHIRWWYAGFDEDSQQPLWVGAISYDNKLKVAHYQGIVTILHAIDPNVDEERDRFATQSHNKGWQVMWHDLLTPKAYSKESHYFTDGKVAVIQAKNDIIAKR
ncbi:hypothetical protein A3K86_16260 [Photobacterium jeanii]|uniref:Uncharacterized protein n=1 Tax=Photobacterium jeanii TaxID=858640 RepID=A0A178K789_9GAMM|nr:LssY C-terminal domain-containing protein [Photobacterium jeanii]OAN13209.1 hypothetical protein A3K86_16260 [Photobacterium jeanii]PST89360.1 hypothetical protein C9I91_14695 [Photobacterium jeanii]